MSDGRIELARMMVHPYCPKCGQGAMFLLPMWDRREEPDALIPVKCSNDRCEWEGLSRRTVPQPKIHIELRSETPEP